MKTECPYRVIAEYNGERGCSSDTTHVYEFNNYKEAKKLYDKIEVPEHRYDFEAKHKELVRVSTIKCSWK